MALRYLATRMRSPATAAFRLPAARSRSFFTTPRQAEQQGKGTTDLESVSRDELWQRLRMLDEQARQILERSRRSCEIVSKNTEDAYGSAKLFAFIFAGMEALLFATGGSKEVHAAIEIDE